MKKIVVSEFVSLDGVMEDPGGASDFEFGGWTAPYWNEDIATFKYDELFACDALLLGRVTYEGFAAAWPSMTDEQGFADRMNSIPKYVVSSTLKSAEWNNSKVIRDDFVEELASLKQEGGRDILVAGSASLARALVHHNLVDEIRLAVYPVVLGTGIRLFGEGDHANLELVDQKTTSSGVVLLSYRRVEQP
jgi:dihydrofolate reductase